MFNDSDVIKEGWLVKYKRQYKFLPGTKRGKQRRYFVLRHERVDYFDKDSKYKGSLLVTPNTQLHERCDDGRSVRIQTEDELGIRGEWFLQAATHEEMDEWIIALFSQTKALLKEAREIALKQDDLVTKLRNMGYEATYAMKVVRSIDVLCNNPLEECFSWIEMNPPSDERIVSSKSNDKPVDKSRYGLEKLKRRQSDLLLQASTEEDENLKHRDDQLVQELVEMGFSKNEAVSGLLMNNDNINEAVVWCLRNRLTTHGVNKDEIKDQDNEEVENDVNNNNENNNSKQHRRKHRRNISEDMEWMERKVESLKSIVGEEDDDTSTGAVSGALVQTMLSHRVRGRPRIDIQPLDLPSIIEEEEESSISGNETSLSSTTDRAEQEKQLQQARLHKAVIDEIVSSEESYVQSLDTLVNVFQKPLMEKAPSILPKDTIQMLFSNVEIICQLQHKFLEDINNRIKSFEIGSKLLSNDKSASPVNNKKSKKKKKNNKVPSVQIGELILSYAPFFKMYIQYVNNHAKAAEFMSNLKAGRLKNMDTFLNFLQEARDNKECRGLTLESFLVMPLQRVPRYKLLLQQLIKRTDPQANDVVFLRTALKKIEEIADIINESLRVEENNQILYNIQQEFSDDAGIFTTGRRYHTRGQVIVTESSGSQTTRRRSLSNDKKYWLFLFNDLLVVAQKSSLATKFTVKQRLSMDRHLELTNLEGKDLVGIELNEDGLIKVVANRTGRGVMDLSVIIKARNYDEIQARHSDYSQREARIEDDLETVNITFSDHRIRDEFIKYFVICMNELRSGNNVVRDFICRVCSKECPLIQRRQCQNCHNLVHNACSAQRWIIPSSDSPEKQRVCDHCAEELQKSAGKKRSKQIVKLMIKRGLLRRKRKKKTPRNRMVNPNATTSDLHIRHTKSSMLRQKSIQKKKQLRDRSESVWN